MKHDGRTGSPVPVGGTESGSMEPASKLLNFVSSRIKVDCSNSSQVLSPSLKPIRIKNLIKSFEENTVSENKNEFKIAKKFCQSSKKDKIVDAFEKLMNSDGVGDTLTKTPKRKPKRLKQVVSTGKEGSFMENWMKKVQRN